MRTLTRAVVWNIPSCYACYLGQDGVDAGRSQRSVSCRTQSSWSFIAVVVLRRISFDTLCLFFQSWTCGSDCSQEVAWQDANDFVFFPHLESDEIPAGMQALLECFYRCRSCRAQALLSSSWLWCTGVSFVMQTVRKSVELKCEGARIAGFRRKSSKTRRCGSLRMPKVLNLNKMTSHTACDSKEYVLIRRRSGSAH